MCHTERVSLEFTTRSPESAFKGSKTLKAPRADMHVKVILALSNVKSVSTYIVGLYAGDVYIGQVMWSRESPVVM